MARQHDGNFSDFVSKTLDSIGYKWETVCRRRENDKLMNQLQPKKTFLGNTGFTALSAGSSREGVCKPFGSDIDVMVVFNEVMCKEEFCRLENNQNMQNLTIFDIDFYGCPPGYAHLVLVKHGGRIGRNRYTKKSAKLYLQTIIEDSCFSSESGKMYLTSETFMRIWTQIRNDYYISETGRHPNDLFSCQSCIQQRAGPSLPTKYGTQFLETFKLNLDASEDNVLSFTCHCPMLFEKFRYRPRRHDCPSQDLLQELSQLDAHAVAIGDKTSENHFKQWRICFTQAEIKLIESLTIPQIHVFVLLRIFAKEVLKKVWDKITSYVVKNVILWIVELTPPRKFQTETIVERFLDCLFFMKICIKAGFLPNYMISERNLLMHEHFIVKRKRLLSLLDGCLYEKGCCLYRSETLKEAMLEMYSRPEVALLRGIERDTTELALLSFMGQVMPEKNHALSFQQLVCDIVSGKAAAFSNLVFEKMSDNEVQRKLEHDPAKLVQELVHLFVSHLK